ncbi:copper homeostasis protein [Psychromonas sp. CNPT3]|uniref:copper homeostasis protein CutC n=1 Tax=Psychromonas sp. CNPT3 TaxID=314282 RepID=UPI0002C123DE|nr:copper homeostasis protein CutC [Psychromonas sp. CNPT3]AGH81549.1 copper homeostasis protein [Psychromonas sp. CNPT3]
MINIEVCIDNITSLFNAQSAGAGRIELCSALALGGLTPSHALISATLKHAQLPIYAMIRPRDGDFLYSDFEIEMMHKEIYHARKLGVQGVVFGVLNENAGVDLDVLRSLMQESKGLGVTFHRAIDCVADMDDALDKILSAGCERILTSGRASNALTGIETIKHMVSRTQGRLSVMAGAGVGAHNVEQIIKQTGIREVHFSAKEQQFSAMKKIAGCGSLNEFTQISVASPLKIKALKEAIVKME